MPRPVKFYKMKDGSEKNYKKKGVMFDLPMKVALVGRSMLSGKTTAVGNLLLSEDPRLYRHEFDGSNIYIFSPSLKTDAKLRIIREQLDVPDSNCFEGYDENVMNELYQMLKEEFEQKMRDGEKPEHKLFYFDDMSAGGDLKQVKNGAISKIASNGRHCLINVIVTAQKYSDLPTGLRENLSGAMLFSGTDKQMELISDDHNYLEDRKKFRKMYREVTDPANSFLVVNYSNPPSQRYLDSEFVPIDTDKY